MTSDERKQRKIEKRLESLLKDKNFEPKYRKNIVVDVCHVESWLACGADGSYTTCDVCFAAPYPRKDRKKKSFKLPRYGIPFHQLYNKRHKIKKQKDWLDKKYITCVCPQCFAEIQKRLDVTLEMSYAP